MLAILNKILTRKDKNTQKSAIQSPLFSVLIFFYFAGLAGSAIEFYDNSTGIPLKKVGGSFDLL